MYPVHCVIWRILDIIWISLVSIKTGLNVPEITEYLKWMLKLLSAWQNMWNKKISGGQGDTQKGKRRGIGKFNQEKFQEKKKKMTEGRGRGGCGTWLSGSWDTEVKPGGATGQSTLPSLVSALEMGWLSVAFSSSPSVSWLRMMGGDAIQGWSTILNSIC